MSPYILSDGEITPKRVKIEFGWEEGVENKNKNKNKALLMVCFPKGHRA